MDVFDITAQGYETDRARLIPCFKRFYSTAVELIPEGADRILDLGAGTGLLSAFVRSRFPSARLHLIDNSAPMLFLSVKGSLVFVRGVATFSAAPGEVQGSPLRKRYDCLLRSR